MNREIVERISMIKNDKTPSKYRKRGHYIIPDDWKVVKLNSLISNLESGVSVNSEDGIVDKESFGVLKVGCVLDGVFKPHESKKIKANEIERAKINPQKGKIIISRANTPELVGAVGYVEKDYKNLFLSDKLWQAEYGVELDAKWLVNVLSSTKIKNRISFLATGTSKSMQNISKKSFLSLEILVPPHEEQQSITSKLYLWDKAIDLKQKLLQEKQKQKKGLMERLLTGKTRLKGFEQKWNKVRLDKIIEESKERSTENNQYDILSVTKGGVFLQSQYFNRQIASEDNIGYKVVRKNDLVFSTMNLWMGSIDILTNYEIGIVSPACKAFYLNQELLDISFMKYFVKSSYMMNLYTLNSEQGASVVRRNLDLNGLISTQIRLPKINEQREIGKILDLSSKETQLLEREIEAIKQQKKGLMQLLLTGIVRVNCD